MRIPIRDHNHKLALLEIRNFEYLPMFYQFPKELLHSGAPYLLDMPRNPIRLLKDPQWRSILTGDAFLSVLLDGAAFLVWPAFEVKANLESFSGYDPLWKMARGIQWWEESLEILMHARPTDLLLMDEGTEMPWLTADQSTLLFPMLAYRAIERHRLRPVIDAVKEMRCIEDFDARRSRTKIDFYRKWYHSQTKHPMISLEGLLERADESGHPISLEFVRYAMTQQESPEESILSRLDMEAFLQTLTAPEREIIELRKRGLTQSEIAKQLNYHTHSAVSKRIAAVAKRYGDFLSTP